MKFRDRVTAGMGSTIRDRLEFRGVFDVLHYERSKSGLLVLKAHVLSKNVVVDEGVNHILNVAFNGATQTATWYMAVFEGNYTPVAGDTAATFPASATECTAYDEAARVAFVEVASTDESITNSASRAVFTFNATKTIYGASLHSVSTKSATTGILMAASQFTTPRAVSATDELHIAYTINA